MLGAPVVFFGLPQCRYIQNGSRSLALLHVIAASGEPDKQCFGSVCPEGGRGMFFALFAAAKVNCEHDERLDMG